MRKKLVCQKYYGPSLSNLTKDWYYSTVSTVFLCLMDSIQSIVCPEPNKKTDPRLTELRDREL